MIACVAQDPVAQDPVARDKVQLRRRLRLARTAALEPADEPARLLEVAAGAGLLDPQGRAGVVGAVTITAYVASPGEPDLGPLRAAVRAAGGRVLLPIPRPGRVLEWAEDDGTYAWAGSLPVQIPTTVSLGSGVRPLVDQGVHLVLAPALAVDRSGARMGQGGGFYDRVLAELAGLRAPEAPATGGARATVGPAASGGPAPPGLIDVLAVVHPDEVLPVGTIPREAHDILVAGALTARGLVRFRS